MGLLTSASQFFFLFFIFNITYMLASLDQGHGFTDGRISHLTPEVRDYLSWLSRVQSLGYENSQHDKNGYNAVDHEFESSKANSVVDQNIIIVSQTPGFGNFQSIQDAIDSVPKGNNQRVVIQITEGTYR